VALIVADADFVMSDLLVAVTMNEPGEAEENVAVVVVWLVSTPPVALHVTPALAVSFATAAVKSSV
jgi:hypothetical protein